MDFKDKVAVITGGASGIGRSLALAMANRGSDIVIADRDESSLSEVRHQVENIGRRALAIRCDISQNDDIKNLADKAISAMGKVDILMNNAGVAVYGVFEKMTIADYEYVLNINVLGTIRCVLAFLPHMLNRASGYIVNTSSAAGLNPYHEPYPLSKYSLVGYSEGLYCYLRPKGILVSVLCPSVVKTNLHFKSPFVGNVDEVREAKLRKERVVNAPDVLNPDDVAKITLDGMIAEKFLIITHRIEQYIDETKLRGRDIIKLEQYLQNTYKPSPVEKS